VLVSLTCTGLSHVCSRRSTKANFGGLVPGGALPFHVSNAERPWELLDQVLGCAPVDTQPTLLIEYPERPARRSTIERLAIRRVPLPTGLVCPAGCKSAHGLPNIE